MATPIKVRDSNSEIRAKLGLNEGELKNLTAFARNAHQEFCESNKDSVWANFNKTWTEVPYFEKTEVTEKLVELCEKARLFTKTKAPQSIIDSALAQRLFLTRQNWQRRQRMYA
ncbi:hypothetical protein PV10_04509 [Exophiala mesophila]|uniref:Uncharacterized protein n=1 Tax=Exophiala mesophila TaxID=212818 RepID=A0A0D2A2I3_EXOME|nr:uncharacterized protein PV10_04509 [Exophiala mesophila]KIV93283.1 hypothetical protein PV10_04509 [Exophiala mesophila]